MWWSLWCVYPRRYVEQEVTCQRIFQALQRVIQILRWLRSLKVIILFKTGTDFMLSSCLKYDVVRKAMVAPSNCHHHSDVIRPATSFISWHPSSAPVGLPNPTGMTVWICQSTPSMKDALFRMRKDKDENPCHSLKVWNV
mgnify:CR=1 FL=1